MNLKKHQVLCLSSLFILMSGCGGGDTAIPPANQPVRLLATTGIGAPDYTLIVQQLYISYFGRPADTGGLASFKSQLAALGGPTDIQKLDQAYHSSTGIKALVDSFGASAESAALYSGDNVAFVTAIYNNVLNRAPDSAGLAFWVGALDTGALTRANASLSIMAGALANTSIQGQLDGRLVVNKVTIGSNFTDALARAPVNGYDGNTAAAKARAMLSSVSATSDIAASQARISSLVENLANRTPSASAGAAQSVTTGSLVTLDASASLGGPSGEMLNYAWTLTLRPPGSSAVFASPTSVKPTFTADVAGAYIASLVVSDSKLASPAATITVTATTPKSNSVPVAIPGSSFGVLPGERVQLDGSASYDADGDALTYQWLGVTRPLASAAILYDSGTRFPTFTPDVPGEYVVSLVVSDGKTSSIPKTMTITAAPAVASLPLNAGTLVQNAGPSFSFEKIDEVSNFMMIQARSCTSFRAGDVVSSSGVVVALSTDGMSVFEIDAIGGACRFIFATPSPMKALAAYRSSGSAAFSMQAYVTTVGVDGRLYHFNRKGALIMSAPLSGVSTNPNVPNLTTLDGIDYAPNGVLYGLINGVVWQMDAFGNATWYAYGLNGSSDIDISEDYTLRFMTKGVAYRYNLIDMTGKSGSWGMGDSGALFYR